MRLTVGEGELTLDSCSAVVNVERSASHSCFPFTCPRLGFGGIHSSLTIRCSTLTTTEHSIWLKCLARSERAVGKSFAPSRIVLWRICWQGA